MTNHTKKITKAQYQRAVQNRGYLMKEDEQKVYTDAERLGYGVYGGRVHERDGKFFVDYMLGDSCD